MSDEPRHHHGYMLLLAITAVCTAPFPFIGAETRFLLGLPTWLWWSLGMTSVFSFLTVWGLLRYWKDDRD
jgi:hypothetical protein